MTIVIDASVAISALVDTERHSEWAESLVASNELAGPELFMAEASNILRRFEAAGQISAERSEAAHDSLRRITIRLFPFSPFSQRIWALRHNLTCYDAWYVAVAEALGCPLATMDLRLARSGSFLCDVILPTDNVEYDS